MSDPGPSGATVLLVDDEERILSALRRTLRREGYRLLTAASRAEALAVLADEPVDLVISDHKMPGTSGLDLLAEVATRHPGVARILLTGWPEEVAPERLAAAGVRAMLPKPWDADGLRATIREALAARAGPSP